MLCYTMVESYFRSDALRLLDSIAPRKFAPSHGTFPGPTLSLNICNEMTPKNRKFGCLTLDSFLVLACYCIPKGVFNRANIFEFEISILSPIDRSARRFIAVEDRCFHAHYRREPVLNILRWMCVDHFTNHCPFSCASKVFIGFYW